MKSRTIAQRAGICLFLWMASNAYATCFDEAGKKYQINPLILKAIAQVESSMDPTAINHNRNGSVDIGLMQINSTHIPRLNKNGITREQLMTDACTSVMVGAEILAGFIAQFGYTWRAVGSYHAGAGAGRDDIRQRYVIKVAEQYQRLSETGLKSVDRKM